MIEYIFDKYEPHEHSWDYRMKICELCGITAEAVAQGRDRPATWEDVEQEYQNGYRLGVEVGRADYKARRRDKLVEVGYYLCLRRLGDSIK